MFTHPKFVSKLPRDCVLITENYQINVTSPGQCLYKPYLGVAYRDKTYHSYMNSQEENLTEERQNLHPLIYKTQYFRLRLV